MADRWRSEEIILKVQSPPDSDEFPHQQQEHTNSLIILTKSLLLAGQPPNITGKFALSKTGNALSLGSMKVAEFRALLALKNDVALKAVGCRFDRGLSGGVCMTLADRGFGCWWYEDSKFKFANVAHQRPYAIATSLEDVISQTRRIAINHFAHNPV